MDYKKEYEEALDRARRILHGDGVAAPPNYSICEVIFPELRDEINVDKIINIIKAAKSTKNLYNDETLDELVNWIKTIKIKSIWNEHQHKLLNYAISLTDDVEVKKFLESLRYCNI